MNNRKSPTIIWYHIWRNVLGVIQDSVLTTKEFVVCKEKKLYWNDEEILGIRSELDRYSWAWNEEKDIYYYD